MSAKTTLSSWFKPGASPTPRKVRWRLWDRTGGGLMAELGSHQLDAASIFISAMHKGEKQHPLSVVAAANRPVFEQEPGSPRGSLAGFYLRQALVGEEDLVVCDIDLAACAGSTARRLFWRDRRPELYGDAELNSEE